MFSPTCTCYNIIDVCQTSTLFLHFICTYCVHFDDTRLYNLMINKQYDKKAKSNKTVKKIGVLI